MPLSAVHMFPSGPIESADVIQFFNLLTGAMTDQPVTLANTVAAGGYHGAGSVPFRVNGVAAQTANMQEVRALGADVNPIFAIGPTGVLKWGPGGGAATDTTITRTGVGILTVSGLSVSSGGMTISGGLVLTGGNPSIGFASQVNPIILTGTGALYFQNNANTAANLHFPDAGGVVIDRGNLSLSAGAILSPVIQGATPVVGASQLGLGVTADAKGAGAAATLGTIGGTGPTVAVQNAWLRININGINCWLPYWT